MGQEATASLKLDTRRAKKDESFPVKLCIYHKTTRQARYYSTAFSFTCEDFKNIWEAPNPRKPFLSSRKELDFLIEKAETDLEGINPFSFQAFETRRMASSTDFKNVFWHFQQRINYFRRVRKSIGTARSFECSQESLKTYLIYLKGSPNILSMDRITREWLEGYERFMRDSGKSKSTTAIYLRALRVVLNAAIEAKALDPRYYPFGKKKYKIKEGGKVKKALDLNEIQALDQSRPMIQEQQKAKDFWFFSYLSNGMNIKDILNLRYGRIGKESFEYERIKTQDTSREGKIITVYLNDFTRGVIDRYGNPRTGQFNQLVFPVLSDKNTPEQNHFKVQAFTRFINQHIKKLAMANGITGEISTYFARHSYATGLLRNGTPPGFIQEALGHASSKTTENYLAGFTSEEKKRVAAKQFQDLKN